MRSQLPPDQLRLKKGCIGFGAGLSVLATIGGLLLWGWLGLFPAAAIAALTWWVTREVESPTDQRPSRAIDYHSVSAPDFDAGPALKQGKEAMLFEYVDADGVVTERMLSPWVEYRRYIRGYCFDSQADRTFRKDRVHAWIQRPDR